MAGRPLTRARLRANARVSSEERIVEGLTYGLLEAIDSLRENLKEPTPDMVKALTSAIGVLADRQALRTGRATAASVNLGSDQLADRVAKALIDAIPDPEQRSRVLQVLAGGLTADLEPQAEPTDSPG